jgi:hypothetical protein
MNYLKYISSAAWRSNPVRLREFEAAGFQCRLCSNSVAQGHALEAHHRTYERLGREIDGDLTALCKECHLGVTSMLRARRYSPKGAQYTADGLRARWGRWLADTPEGREICRRWKEWVGAQVKKYDWDIDPDDADHPTIHGLRGTGILARAEQGYEVDQIANDIGMSRQNVEHYMRFRDQMKVGADGQKRLRLVNIPGSGD